MKRIFEEKDSFGENSPAKKNIFSNHRIITRVLGFHPIFYKTDSVLCKIVNISYFLWVDFIYLHMFLICLCSLCKNLDNFLVAAETIMHVCTLGSAFCVNIYCQIYSNKIIYLMDYAEKYFRYRSARGISVTTLKASIVLIKRMNLIIFSMNTLAVFHWMTMAMMKPSKKHHRRLPFDMDYPVDVQTSPRYEIALVMQMWAQTSFAIFISCITTLYITFSLLVRGQFIILCSSLRNVCHTGALRAGVPYRRLAAVDFSLQNDQHEVDGVVIMNSIHDCRGGKEIVINTDVDSASYHMDYSIDGGVDFSPYETLILEAIADCVKHLQDIREFAAKQQQYFSSLLFYVLYAIMLETTVSLYATTSEKFQLEIFEYCVASSINLLMYCTCGTIVEAESVRAHTACWEAGWWAAGPHVGKALAFCMQHTNRAIQLSAGPFYKLTLHNFLGTMKICFSFVTLIRNMGANGNN